MNRSTDSNQSIHSSADPTSAPPSRPTARPISGQSSNPASEPSAAAIRQPLARAMTGAAGLTGEWRLQRPVLDPARCNGCLLCWILCPDGVIARDTRAIDYDYCKGCGICAAECPRKAIAMVKEGE